MTTPRVHDTRSKTPAARLAATLLALAALPLACRTPTVPPPTAQAEPAANEQAQADPAEPLPGPGEPVPIDPVDLDVTGELNEPPIASVAPEEIPNQRAVVQGEVADVGPFRAADAADGEWLQVDSVAGQSVYVLLPAALAVQTQNLHINVGDSIRAEGFWDANAGRRYLRASSVAVTY